LQERIGIFLLILTVSTGLFMATRVNPLYADVPYRYDFMWPVLKQPWHFKEPVAAASDPDGYIYIADRANDRIVKLTEDGTFVAFWGKEGEQDGEFRQPQGVAVDREEFVYVVDSQNKRIQKFNSDGQFILKWHYADQTGVNPMPAGIAVDAKGDVYVTDIFLNKIYKFTNNGVFLMKWGEAGSGDAAFSRPYGIAADLKGHIYVADSMNGRVQKFHSDGTFIESWGTHGELNKPFGIAVDKSGNIYVSDLNSQKINLFDATGDLVASWGASGVGDGEFSQPTGVAIGSGGIVFVCDNENDAIQKFTPDGRFLARFGRENRNGGMNSPQGLAIAPNGNVYVADTRNHKVQMFDRKGNYLTHWGGLGEENGRFDSPERIAIGPRGYVYVADTGNNRIQKFDPSGAFQWKAEDGLLFPSGMAAGPNGYVYVADTGNDCIRIFDANGNHLAQWTGESGEPFSAPQGVAVGPNGNIYIADTGNHVIKQYNPAGALIQKWGGRGAFAFDQPKSVSVDNEGHLYVADVSHHIFKLNAAGRLIAKWGGEGGYPGQFKGVGDGDIGPEGKFFVPDIRNHRIQIFSRQTADRIISKAIVIAGGGPYPGNKLWDATRLSAHYAYRCLSHRGFSKDAICYLSSDAKIDLDDNGLPDDVDGLPSAAALQNALGDAEDANRLILYLVDHGGKDKFRLSETETLSAEDLSHWLDVFQFSGDGNSDIIFVYDACNGGDFIRKLQGNASRILIAGSESEQSAHFINQGSISFSSFFWNHIFNGEDVDAAFSKTTNALAGFAFAQTPVMTRQGLFTYAPGSPIYIGGGPLASPGQPEIQFEEVADLEENFIRAKVIVKSPENMARVWAVVIPDDFVLKPSDAPVLELPSIDLFPEGQGLYRGILSQPAGNGYNIVVYAKDRFGNVFASSSASWGGGSTKKRRAILVASDADCAQSARTARHALEFQGYSDDAIQILSPDDDGAAGGAQAPTPSSLKNALTALHSENTHDLVLYLCGEGEPGALRLNISETLHAQTLSTWLNDLQNRIPGDVAVICDGDYSGSFLPALVPPRGRTRMVIASASADRRRISTPHLSFSAFFWRQIFNGANTNKAFGVAKQNLGLISGLPKDLLPLLDDNGNGIGNERSDGQKAENFTIGSGFRLADAAPVIAELETEAVLNGAMKAAISADLSSFSEIDDVWAVLSRPSPEYEPEPLTETILFESLPGADVWQGGYDRFDVFGVYSISVYASDANGGVSVAKKSDVLQAEGKDVYEPDDAPFKAKPILIDSPVPQHRSLHAGEDADWAVFYGRAGIVYTIRTANPGIDSNHLLELRDGNRNIEVDIQEIRSDAPAQTANMILWICPANGLYYIGVRPAPTPFFLMRPYFLEIFRSEAVFSGWLKGMVSDDITGLPVSGARIATTSGGSAISLPSGRYRIVQEPQNNIVATIEADGYHVRTVSDIVVSEGGATVLDIALQPLGSEKPDEEDEDGDGNSERVFPKETMHPDDDVGGAGCFIHDLFFR